MKQIDIRNNYRMNSKIIKEYIDMTMSNYANVNIGLALICNPILLALIMCFPLDSNLKYLLAVCKVILTYEESTCKSIADVSHNLHILDLQSTFRFVSLKELTLQINTKPAPIVIDTSILGNV